MPWQWHNHPLSPITLESLTSISDFPVLHPSRSSIKSPFLLRNKILSLSLSLLRHAFHQQQTDPAKHDPGKQTTATFSNLTGFHRNNFLSLPQQPSYKFPSRHWKQQADTEPYFHTLAATASLIRPSPRVRAAGSYCPTFPRLSSPALPPPAPQNFARPSGQPTGPQNGHLGPQTVQNPRPVAAIVAASYWFNFWVKPVGRHFGLLSSNHSRRLS
jgi:hypothetical protein